MCVCVCARVRACKCVCACVHTCDHLLCRPFTQSPTPLEQALATQSVKRKVESHSVPTPVHLVAVIASYIHHHDDPHVPAGATRLLSRLSQVAPMSVFACLGSEAAGIRDAFMHRLRSHVEVRGREREEGEGGEGEGEGGGRGRGGGGRWERGGKRRS